MLLPATQRVGAARRVLRGCCCDRRPRAPLQARRATQSALKTQLIPMEMVRGMLEKLQTPELQRAGYEVGGRGYVQLQYSSRVRLFIVDDDHRLSKLACSTPGTSQVPTLAQLVHTALVADKEREGGEQLMGRLPFWLSYVLLCAWVLLALLRDLPSLVRGVRRLRQNPFKHEQ
eukprot:TRINITY_DN2563_c0_g1_i2.p2 TRINITY_DN2563_c0_g1~~TRINITY_DN2563_c0_g1_i2.p2  ORF type:complete len:174 (+),score=45.07 TRINITY_DN2563_c0_g1_i2:429-950(+)